MSAQVSLAESLTLNFRKKVVLDAIDDEITDWFLLGKPDDLPRHLGMTIEEYGRFLFNPGGWVTDFVTRLHGE